MALCLVSLPHELRIALLESGFIDMLGILRSHRLLTLFLALTIPAFPQTVHSAGSAAGTSAISGNDTPTNLVSASFSTVSDEELGQLMIYRQQYQAAIEAFKRIESPSARVWNQIGIAYQMMYDYKDARRCYDEALRLRPHDPIVLSNLATAQDGMGDFGAAEKNYRKSLKLDSNSALTLKNLGTNLLMQHKYEAGAAAYKDALSIDPRIFEDHIGVRMSDPAPTSERGTAAYFKAKSCALAGLNDCAIAFLRKAMDEGLTLKQLSEEHDLAALRKTSAYINLIATEQ
jgi:Flp pilus assembly protein TadD